MQRLHVADLVGHLLERDDSWTHLTLPAIADSEEEIEIGPGEFHRRAPGEVLHSEREPIAALNDLRDGMGSQAFSAQYQQAPVPSGGALVQRSWFRSYNRAPDRNSGDRVVQSWDTASKAGKTNDYSVCTTWLMRGGDYYLLDVYRQRLAFPDLRRFIVSHAEAYDATGVLIEDASSGVALIQDLQDEGKVRPIAIQPEGDKTARLEGQTPVIEAGHVLLPQEAPWLADFLVEILAFPAGRYDDQVDSLSQFLTWAFAERRRRQPPLAIPGTGLCRPSRWAI